MLRVAILTMSCVAMVMCMDGKVNGEKRLVLHSDEDVAAAIHAMQAEMLEMKTTIADLKSQTSTGQGSTYVRWGRTSCQPNGTEMVYKGFAGGHWFNTAGGAADYICLTEDTLWGVYDDASHGQAKVYGAEYQLGDQFSDGGKAMFGQNLYQHDAPCAVCHTTRATTLMIPGRNLCYPGWTLEYSGYLVSGSNAHSSATNYACLDSRAEVEQGDVDNENGKLIYVTEAECGTLRCPPYVQNREITCVVCSK